MDELLTLTRLAVAVFDGVLLHARTAYIAVRLSDDGTNINGAILASDDGWSAI